MKRLPLAIAIALLLTKIGLTQATNPIPAGERGAAKSSANVGEQQPVTSNPTGLERESNIGDPLLDATPLPKGKVTLVGGRVGKIDPIRNRLTLDPFGDGQKMKIFFDERTHIYRDGIETTQANIHKGDRVYVDTMADGPHVFARNIRVMTQRTPADASGQIVSYNPRSGAMTVQDQLSTDPVTFSVDPQTIIKKRESGQPASSSELRPGSLVTVRFVAVGQRRAAQEIGIIAVPGAPFTFVGKVVHLDVHNGTIAIDNQSDNKTYDINFDPARIPLKDELTVGSQVIIDATFTAMGYRAAKISMNQ